jgi:hypothetical protein
MFSFIGYALRPVNLANLCVHGSGIIAALPILQRPQRGTADTRCVGLEHGEQVFGDILDTLVMTDGRVERSDGVAVWVA